MSSEIHDFHVAAERTMAQNNPDDVAIADQIDDQCYATANETNEQLLQRVWGAVLGIDDISAIQSDDSFFTLGGDSNSILRLVSEARRCGIALSVPDVYQNPRLSELAKLCVTASEQQLEDDDSDIQPFDLIRDLLDDDVESCRKQLAHLCNVDVVAVEDVYPCTPLQEGLFALSQKAGVASEKYTQQFVLRLRPDVQLSKFKATWRESLQAVPILRTRIAQHEKLGLVQVVIKEEMQWITMPGLEGYLEQDKLKTMGLGEPLARYGLVMSDTASRTFILTINHALYDGGSIAIVQRLLNHLYDGAGQPVPHNSFNRFVKYASETSRSDDSRAFWELTLADCKSTPFPPLPTSPERAETREKGVVEESIPAPPAAEVSLATIIRAAWALLVHNNTGDNDVVFGMTMSGLNAPITAVQDIIGPTIATVPVRVQIFPTDTVAEFLDTLQDQMIEMFPHEQTGLQYIAKVSKEAAAATAFQTLMVIQPPEDGTESTLGVWSELATTEEFATAYALSLECKLSTTGSMAWKAIFDPQALEPWRVTRMLKHLGLLIHQLADATAGEKQLAELVLPPSHDLDHIWSLNRDLPPPVSSCIHTAIEQRAAEEPESLAVHSWDGDLTYKEFNQRADRLARHLVALGIGQGSFVPLMFEKSVSALVAMLATMKAGAAFVPLDPKQASQRRNQILDQIGARIALMSQHYSTVDLGSETRQSVVVGPAGSGPWDAEELQSLSLPKVAPEMPCYVIFTSGSTGTPKGVVIQHSAIRSSSHYHGNAVSFSKSSRAFQFASFTFDASIMEIITTLVFGGCVCMPCEVGLLENLNESIQSLEADTVALTPSVARLLNPDVLPSLTTILLAGEASTADDFLRWQTKDSSQGKIVFHAFGPTEASVLCAVNNTYPIDTVHTAIGLAVGGSSWIVSPEDHNQLLPFGAVGELLIEGPILAQGYLGNPEKTAEAFIEDPPWLVQGAPGRPGRRGRLYKTGDLVRYCDENGNIAFVSRKSQDTQVKIRGQRVDLVEVEHQVTSSLPQACLVVSEIIYPSGDKTNPTIAAFVSPKDATNTDVQGSEAADTLTAKLMCIDMATEATMSDRLPAYMIPTVFFSVRNMPLNTSGKTDRKKLREFGSSFSLEKLTELRNNGRRRQPKTDTQRTLQQIWAKVINMSVESIGLDDNFFRIGGDSIAVMRLVGQLRQANISVSSQQIFRNPKLIDQARLLLGDGHEEEQVQITPFQLIGDVDRESCLKEVAEMCQVGVSDVEDIYPCTPLQEGLISLSLKMEGDYVLQRVMDIPSSIDLNRFCQAWGQLARFTPILRTRIVQESTLGLVQVVINEDLQWSTSENLAECMEQTKADVIGLGRSLVRYCLVTDPSTQQTSFVWTIHHALYDGWSMPMFLEQVAHLYHDVTAVLLSAPQFNHFVAHLLQKPLAVSDAYWRDELAGFDTDAFPVLPSNVTQPAADLRAEKTFLLPQKLRAVGLTPSAIVTAAWALVVYQHTRTTDVVFGNTVSGRNAPVWGIENIMGPTIATLPVRVRISPQESTISFLEKVQDEAAERIAHEQTGLQYISKVSPEAQRVCDSFQTLLVVQGPEQQDPMNDLSLQWKDVAHFHGFSTYALTLICHMSAAGETSKIEAWYDSRVLDSFVVHCLLDQLIFQIQQLVEIAASSHEGEKDDRPVQNMEVMPSAHSQVIWNRNRDVPPPIDRCLQELIAERTAELPDAPAICSWDGNLTYGELDHLSTRLARHLVGLGVGPRTLVPLFFEKSKFAIIAILAVLKSGGAYVPLDPTQAEERRRYVLKQTNAKLIITSERYSGIAAVDTVVVVGPTTLKTDSGDWFTTDIPARPNPEWPCYVIFTSGSTGMPKGVVVTHRSISSACSYHGEIIGLSRDSRFLQFSNYAFDASVFEIITTLIHGGCVVVPSEEDRFEDIASVIASNSVNTAFFTPSLARLIDPERVPSLTTVLLGGEASSEADLLRWKHCETLMNLYGPTECSIICTATKVISGVTPTASIGPHVGCIGWICDPQDVDRLMPLGAVGELLIEGPILAEGYLNDEEKTLNAFVQSPAWLRGCRPDSRLYKTGDLVRYGEDGSFHYEARKDTQVKIRGQRVELGEVERWLGECFPRAKHVVAEVVTVRRDETSPDSNTQVLAAFISEQDEEPPEKHEYDSGDEAIIESMSSSVTVTETKPAVLAVFPPSSNVKQQLSKSLPQYMVPSVFFSLSSMVLNAAGKIDRKALARLVGDFTLQELVDQSRNHEKNGEEGERERHKPSTEAEIRLTNLWARALKISASSIGLDDNFFQVGGDSIGAIKLVGEARRQGITLSVAQIFQNPILSDLAQTLLEAKVDDKESDDKDDIVPFSLLPTDANPDIARCLGEIACLCDTTVDDVEDAYPCTPLQEGLLSLTAKNSNNFVMQRVLELGTEMDAQRFKEAWHEVIRSTPILRTRIVQHPELGFLQVVFKEASWVTANTLEDYLENDKCHVMGVGVALARFALIQDQQKTCFALTCHHALYDGWSLPLIENKLATAYMSSKDALLTKSPGFNSFLKYTLQNGKPATEEFWKASLAGFEGSTFPPVPSMTKFMKAYAKIDKVYALPPSKIRGITPGTIIRGAWALSVQRWTGTDEDVVFGSTVSGRNAPVSGIESIAGPTIATVPVRIRVSGSSSLSSYLQGIQSQAIAMIPYEQIGLQYLAKISPEAQLACDFRTLLVVQPSETDDDGSYPLGTWRDISEAEAFAAYPLTLICQLCADGNVRLSAVHDPRAIDEWRLERLLDQFEMAIQQLTESHQDQLLEGLNILSPNDSNILWSWNKNVPVASKSCVHELIQKNALENPSAMAVDAWDGQLSNSELDRLSTTLAKHLIRHCSVQPGTTIPLYFEKSMWITVSILGVLKAGCNFLMIDPAQASDRRKHILRQVDATVILASETYKEVAAEVCNEVVAVASSFDSVREQIDDTECLPSAKLSDTCYIMYTSGSTGLPKGIVVTHEALASSTLHHGRRAGLNETTRILQFASYSFDACILELITSLVFGGRICIPSDEDRLDIAKSITSFSANTAFFTPTVARLVDPQMVPTLKTLILGGEAVSIEDFQRWSHLDRLQNGFGPTETVVFCCMADFYPSDYVLGSIGTPVGCSAWVVHPHNHDQLMPTGATGELVIEGPIVSAGYLQNDDATEAAFIHDPTWLVEGMRSDDSHRRNGRLYKTGDLCSFNSDGSLIYVGRKDSQVKIRGQRLELGEVEHQVAKMLPDVEQVVAEVIPSSGDDSTKTNMILAAFLIKKHEEVLDVVVSSGGENIDDIKVELTPVDPHTETDLAEVLPSYMVPSIFFTINRLPLSTAGKIDRRKLRSLTSSLSTQQIASVQSRVQENRRLPSTKPELALQQIFAKVLNLESSTIGLDDSFFRLGGDSILAVLVSSAARSQRLDVSAANILRNKTIARILQQCSASGVNFSEPIIQSISGQTFPLSPMQQLFFATQDDHTVGFDQSVLVGLRTRISFSSLQNAFQTIVRSHAILRARFRCVDGVWEQYIDPVEDLDRSADVKHHRYASDDTAGLSNFLAEARTCLDIEEGPLVTVALLESSDSKQSVFIAIHHLIVDIISWHILLQDLEGLLSTGTTSISPTLPFPVWSGLQANHAKKQLGQYSLDVASVSPPPTSYWGTDDVSLTEEHAVHQQFTLDETTTSAIMGSVCNGTFQTRPVELMISALLSSFSSTFTDRPIPTVWNEGHGRQSWDESIDISHTVGWFTEMTPVTLNVTTPLRGDVTSTIRLTKDAIRSSSQGNQSAFASQFIDQERAKTCLAQFPVEVLFNFNGVNQQLDGPDSFFYTLPLPGNCAPANAKRMRRFALFDVVASIIGGSMVITIIFDRHFKHQERISAWAEVFQTTMTDMAVLLPTKQPGWTLSDFSNAFKSYDDIEYFTTQTMPTLGIHHIHQVEDIFPCSAMQEGIMITQIKNPEHYRFSLRLEVSSAAGSSFVDVQRIKSAWRSVVQRHALLRAVFVDKFPGAKGTMLIVLRDPDLSVIEETEPASLDTQSPWGYTKDTVQHQLVLRKLSDRRLDVEIKINHTIVDGHSVGLLIRDLQMAYNDQDMSLEAASYKDFVSCVDQRSLAEGVSYWAKYLCGVEPCFFPTSMEGEEARQKRTVVRVEGLDTARIREFCSTHELTPATVVQTAWSLVLSRYSRNPVACFGVLSSGRDTPVDGIDDMMGPTLGMLISRVDASGGRSVLDTLRAVQRDYVESLPHQHVPLAAIHGALNVGTSSLFNSAMSFQRSPSSIVDTDSAISIKIKEGEDPTEFDVAVRVVDGDEISIVVECRGRLNDQQAQQIGSCFSSAIASITTHWEGDIKDVDLLGDQDRSRIWSWNATVPPTLRKCVHDVVSERVREEPNAPALWSWDGNLTYGQLDETSTRIALHLVKLGVGPEVMVPTFFEKSMWTVVAYLAILKAGGAFVPLDPTHPLERRERVLSQTKSRLAITSEKYSNLSLGEDITIVPLGPSSSCLEPLSEHDAASIKLPQVSPDSACYVIFTSGSTGLPKGVLQPHSSVCSGTFYHGTRVGFGRSTRTLQFSNYTFDASIAEIITSLTWGACVCVPSEKDRLERLGEAVTEMRANLTIMTPSVAKLLDPKDAPTLKTVILGGEASSEDDFRRWAPATAIDGFGPSEAVVFSVMNVIDFSKPFQGSIGSAVGSVSWVVDPEDANILLPIGAIGELLTEGPILAREYVNAPETTADAFMEDPPWLLQGHPASGQPGRKGRLYKTRDLVKYAEDGTLLYLGRKDTQVKVRGHRIELGEVEYQITKTIPMVEQVAAEAIRLAGDESNLTLAAFIICNGDEMTMPTEGLHIVDGVAIQPISMNPDMETWLSQRLPSYMIPSIYFLMDELPLNTSGKVERKTLRTLAGSFTMQQIVDLRSSGSSTAPKRTPTTDNELVLHGLWARLLNIESSKIGLDDHFFQMGGDSITAMQMVADVRRSGLMLSVAQVFQSPRLADLAQQLSKEQVQREDSIGAFELIKNQESFNEAAMAEIAELCDVDLGAVEDAYPCTPLQEGLLSLTLKQAGDYILQSVMKLAEDLDMDRFRMAWEHVVRLTPILRTRVVQTSSLGLLQVVLKEGILWNTSATSLDEYLADDKLYLGLGLPLVRYGMIDSSTGPGYFVWSIHHALYDGGSIPLILDMVNRAYHGMAIVQPPGFNRFVRHIIQRSEDADKEFWKATFSGYSSTPFPAMPPGLDRIVATSSVEKSFDLPSTGRSSTTQANIMRAAFALVARHHSETNDIAFGVTVSGRNAPVTGIDSIIGPTIATIPVRVQVPSSADNLSIASFINSVQEQATATIPFEQTGLQYIEQTSPEAKQACTFQTLLVIQQLSEAVSDTSHSQLGLWQQKQGAQNQEFTTYGLTLVYYIAPGATFARIEASFDPRIISSWKVKLILDQLAFVIPQLTCDGNAQTRLIDLVVSPPEEQAQVWAWNGSVPTTTERCIHELVNDRVVESPAATAISAWDGELTYGELDRLSTLLATYMLENTSFQAGNIVALCFEKSRWTHVSALAVLKAGGTFVFLDRGQPIDRLQSMLLQTGAAVMLTSASVDASLATSVDTALTICLEFVAFQDTAYLSSPAATQLPKPDPKSAMYVIFTSGTTGEPKGTVVSHRAFTTAMTHQAARFGYTRATRAYDFSSYGFDVAISTAFMTLVVGGCLCVPSEEDRHDNLAASIASTGANLVDLTPSVLRLLDPKQIPQIKTIVLGGEALQASDLVPWASSQVRLKNAYGPAECAPTATINDSQCPEELTRIGTGAGAVTWVVQQDDYDQLSPLGTIGELLLEGPLVSDGYYLNDPERTATSFIEAPAWLVRGLPDAGINGRQNRLYKTGDLVCYNEDGSLTYIGRKDTQIKLRGMRVELGEVEHRIEEYFSSNGTIRKAVVEVIQPGESQSQALAAFIVMEVEEADIKSQAQRNGTVLSLVSSLAGMKEDLSKYLPTYMIPTVCFAVNQIPLTVSSKADRRTLRELGSTFTVSQLADLRTSGQKRPPSTPSECKLQTLWSKVLDIETSQIGADDSFFHLGGSSISAMRLVGLARHSGLTLSVAEIFKTPVLSTLAATIAGLDNNDSANGIQASRTIEPFALLPVTKNSISEYRDYVADMCGVQATAVEDIYPCTPLQEGMFSLGLQKTGGFVLQRILSIPEHINIPRLHHAWSQVVRDIPILRTRIVQRGTDLLQAVIVSNADSVWSTEDDLETYLDSDKKVSMSLYRPLTRLAFVDRPSADGQRHLVWTVHHAVYDALSLSMIDKLVQDAYNGLEGIPIVPFNAFLDYFLRTPKADSDAFWSSKLGDFESDVFPELPTAMLQPQPNTRIDATYQVNSGNIHSGITSASLLKAAWALTVYHRTDLDDVVFGATVSGRNAALPGIEAVVGPTIATVPVRIKVCLDQSLSSYLELVQAQAADMIPFEQAGLQNISKLSSAAKRACDFQTLLVVQSGQTLPTADIDSDGQADTLGNWRDVAQTSQFTTYAITLLCHHTPTTGEVDITAMFDPMAISEWKLRSYLDHFGFVLKQLLAAREFQTIGDLQHILPSEVETLWKWNASVPPPVNRCIQDTIRDHVSTRPDSPAVSAWDGELTYQDLDTLSSNLAHLLLRHAVGPKTMVPICFGKTKWAIVAMLGILKAGAAFVPIDPSQPLDRIKRVLKQSNARVIVTSDQLSSFPFGDQDGCLSILSVGPSLPPCPPEAVGLPQGDPEGPCYVIFTSGSTGTPKGVLLQHRAISSSAFHHGLGAGMDHTSRVLQFSKLTFDASIVETLTCLSFGGCVCIPSEADVEAGELSKPINDMSVNTAFVTPSVARLIDPQAVPSMHTILLAGEKPTEEDFSRWTRDDVQRDVIQGYGPTEAAVLCAMNPGIDATVHTSIGTATGCVSWVVKADDHMTLAPIGTVGELLIEGPILAAGYVGNPELTDGVFVTDPTWLTKGGRRGRVYKTGDLVRYNEDGTLIYVSRKDTQIKLRGQRLELGEVEYQVSQCMPEASAVVAEVVHPGGKTSNAALAVFFVNPNVVREMDHVRIGDVTATLIALDSVTEQLGQSLPAYMVPSIFFHLDHLPMNSSGKTDRKLLRELGSSVTLQQLSEIRSSRDGREEKRLPTTEEECALQSVWAWVLNIDPHNIGLDDSFFSLGGDSITAMQASSAARSKGLDVSTANIVKNKTISLILKNMQPAVPTAPSTNGLHGVIQEGESDLNTPFPLSPIQQLFFQSQPDPVDVTFDQYLLLRPQRRIVYSALVSAIETIVSRHPILRARFQQNQDSGAWEQYITSEVNDSVRLLHQCPSATSEMSMTIQNIRAGMDITTGPLVAAALFEESSGSQALFLDIHHLVTDIVSWRILLTDLEELLTGNGHVSKTTHVLPFHKWSKMQHDFAAKNLSFHNQQASVAAQPPLLSYWGTKREDILESGTTTKTFTLERSVSTSLLDAERNDTLATRPIELMIAALLHSFSEVFSDRPLPTVFNENHGREVWEDSLDVSQTVGWFTTISPVTIDTPTSEPPRRGVSDMIQAAKKSMRYLDQDNGWSYFTSQFINEKSAESFSSNFPAEILFNYGGSYQQLERNDAFFENIPLPEGCSPPESFGRLRRYALFEFVVGVIRGQITVTTIYNRDIKHAERVSEWLQGFKETLDGLAQSLTVRP